MKKPILGSKGNPIKCEGPPGERAYLNRLLGPDEQFLTYKREGSTGGGPTGNMLDIYLVRSLDGSFTQELYFDMYWAGYEEEEAPPNFSFIADFKGDSSDSFNQMVEKNKLLLTQYGDSECRRFGYIWAKSDMLSQLGPSLYASKDAFGMPHKNFNLREIVQISKDISTNLSGSYQHIPLQFSSRELTEQFFLTLHYLIEPEELEKIENSQAYLLKMRHKLLKEEVYIWVKLSQE